MTKMTIVKISDKGQIAIPKEIREDIGIKKGDELVLLQMNGMILLEKSQNLMRHLNDDFKDIIKFNEKSLKDMWNNKSDAVWDSYKKK